jgi:hypothetical protein
MSNDSAERRFMEPEQSSSRGSDKPVFHVVIIYQNSAAGRRAKHFYDKLVRAFDGACDFSLELWNFKLIAIPEIRESTAQAAAHADLVILSLYANSGLPAKLISVRVNLVRLCLGIQ